MPQFDVSSFSSQLFWLVLVFGLLYFFINKFIVPKAESILIQRNSFIEENINHAQEYSKKAKLIEELRENKLEEVNLHVKELNKQAIDSINLRFSQQMKELSVILDKKKEKIVVEIEDYIDTFHLNEPDSCIKLAAFIIQKVTSKDADMVLLKKIYEKIK